MADSKLVKLIKLLKTPSKLILKLNSRGYLKFVPDEEFLKFAFYHKVGYKLNLDEPKTFNEKLQWLKLYDRRPEYTAMVDKYEVKKTVADMIGDEYIIPTLGVWDSFDEIDFEPLPERFVLKCTHDSGGVVICKAKSSFDIEKAEKKLKASLKRNYYWVSREWPYKNVKKRIICEEYLQDADNEVLTDYKVLCFNGEPRLIQLHSGRHTEAYTQDIYDTEWNLTDFFNHGYPLSGKSTERPKELDLMLTLSRKLAQGLPHVRVDWYSVNGKLYFGELTLYTHGGLCAYGSGQDELIGEWLELPKERP